MLLVIASAAGSLSWAFRADWDAFALTAGGAFTAAAGLRLVLLRSRPHRDWYDGRAAAESIKTLAWKYAVGGDPFIVGEPSAGLNFSSIVSDVGASFDSLRVSSLGRTGPTSTMDGVRAQPLDDRRTLYRSGRLEEQRTWYSRKAAWNQKRARFWGVIVLSLQLIGAIGAFLKGFGLVDIDLFGLAGAAVASAAAWLETKQHHTISRAYQVAADELGAILNMLPAQRDEESWARFVAEAEEAISREHTMWKASTRSREPLNLA